MASQNPPLSANDVVIIGPYNERKYQSQLSATELLVTWPYRQQVRRDLAPASTQTLIYPDHKGRDGKP